jgi:hypothetical protein
MLPLLEDPARVAHTRYWRTPRCGCRGPRCVPSQSFRVRQTGLTGGEILPTHGYRDVGSNWCGLLLGRVLFMLVVAPLQPGVVEPYLVRGRWFSSHLLLEGTGSYLNFLAITNDLRYPGYKTPIVAPKPFVERVERVIHLTGGRICTHMSLWVPLRVSEVSPWG